MGTPPKHIELDEKLCSDFSLVLKLNKVEKIIENGCGERQGDNLETNLFIIVIQLVDKGIPNKFSNHGAEIPTILCDPTFSCALKLHHC